MLFFFSFPFFFPPNLATGLFQIAVPCVHQGDPGVRSKNAVLAGVEPAAPTCFRGQVPGQSRHPGAR